MRRAPVILTSATLAVAVMLSGCSDDGDGDAGTSSSTAAATTTTTAAPPTAEELAAVPAYLAGEGAVLVRFVRETAPLAGKTVPSPTECRRFGQEVLPAIAATPQALRDVAARVPDPVLARLFTGDIDAKVFLLGGCAQQAVPDKASLLTRTKHEPLVARLAQYGVTV